MFGNIGLPEILMIFVIALLVFGPRKLPEIARQLGQWSAHIRRMMNDVQNTFQDEIRKAEQNIDNEETNPPGDKNSETLTEPDKTFPHNNHEPDQPQEPKESL